MTDHEKLIAELRERLRIAEAVRDDARTASQRYLDEKRAAEALLEARERRLDQLVEEVGLLTRMCRLDAAERQAFRAWMLRTPEAER